MLGLGSETGIHIPHLERPAGGAAAACRQAVEVFRHGLRDGGLGYIRLGGSSGWFLPDSHNSPATVEGRFRSTTTGSA